METKSMNKYESGLNNKGAKLPQYKAAAAVCIGAAGVGAVLSWTATITEELREKKFNNLEIDDTALSWIGSLVPLGAVAMCFPIGVMCDKLGRRLSMLLFSIPFFLGWLLVIFAQNLAMLYVGRFMTGLSGGAFCVAAPLYTSEVAEKEIRGTLTSFYELFMVGGALFANVLSYFVDVKTYTIVLGTMPLIFALVFVFEPETPLFRVKQGREEEARGILIRLRGKKYDVDAELQEIKMFLETRRNNKISFKESLQKRSTKVAAGVCFSLMFFQQLNGIKAVIFYTVDIFQAAGTNIDDKISTIIFGATSFLAIFLSSNIIDRLGRRLLLITSGIFIGCGLCIIGAFFTLQNFATEELLSKLNFAPILGICVFSTANALGIGPIPWIMSAELFPIEIKGLASASAGTISWFLSFLMTKFYFRLSLALGQDVTFYMFAGCSVIGSVFSYFFVPETKGKSLEQIQNELNSREVGKGRGNPAYIKS